ncbi:lipopolysaccharide biosynthesis protein [Parabacteroides distasonis]|uniref:lipopolysaccharide biosynthesis protein n=1 Tax=Parabacteroides distasonis TaxID=823 RepID=UPI0012B1757E|nr:lipopolysaccharide biosynthesis protein [Parabacteroides distasonis]MRZ34738.1 oligosaccharide flippase family protein [Parabacteroides distasonis]
MQGSLKGKTIHGVIWSLIDNVSSSGVIFFVGIILARLLTPEEYGVMAMVSIFIAISNSIIDSGFSSALIRKVKVKPIEYNTVFYFNLLISLLLYICLFFISPFIALFFREPILCEVMRVIGLILIINALSIIPYTIFVREINFKTQTIISLIASVGSGVIGVWMAFSGQGVWSLVGQQLGRQCLNTLFLWFFCHWKPTVSFSMTAFKEMFGFGSKLLLSGLLDTIYKDIYYIVIGRCFSSSILGQYTRAKQFSMVFSTNLTTVVQRVSFPVLSSIQDDSIRLREAYRKVIKSTMLVSFACMLGLAAIAKPLLILLISDKWLPAVYFLQIVCFSNMLYPLHAINLNILKVKGRSDVFLKLEVIKKVLAIFPILVGVYLGIEMMHWGSVIISVISYFLNAYYSASLINYSVYEQLKDIFPSFIVSLGVGFLMWSISLLSISYYLMLIIQLSTGFILAYLIYNWLRLDEFLEIKSIANNYVKKFYKSM